MCTSIRFTDNSGHMYLGRNLDWSFDYGQQVRVMPRGFHIPYSFIDDATAAHAVIGMCIDYKNYPMFFDCGNDAGLAVAGLNFPGYAEYAEDPVDGKTNIAAYEFPLWVAATFSTVDEVEAALRDTVIVAKSAGEGLGVSLLHWIIGDSQRSIVVEMMADGLHVYGDPVDTLANQPPSRGTWKTSAPISPPQAIFRRRRHGVAPSLSPMEPVPACAAFRAIAIRRAVL